MTTVEMLCHQNGISTDDLQYSMQEVDPTLIIGLRPFLVSDRMEGKRRRCSKLYPVLISHAGNFFCVDGHHKVRRAYDNEQASVTSEVYNLGDNYALSLVLMRRASGYIKDLEIRDYQK